MTSNNTNDKKQEFKKRMAILANTKIDNFMKQHFSDQTQSEMTLFDHLKLKMRGSNIAAQLLVSRIIDGVDWDLDPALCQNKIKQVLAA